jgi:type IV secretory pathway VirB10-like protein
MSIHTSDTDPRGALSEDVLDQANRRTSPAIVTASGITPGMALGFVGVGLLGVLTFTTLTNSRTEASLPSGAATALRPGVSPTIIPVGPLSPKPVLMAAPGAPTSLSVMPPIPGEMGPSPAALANAARLKSPALVVDLAKPLGFAAAEAKPGEKPGMGISADEQFADRISDAESKPARATRITNGGDMVPQGAVVAAVLETAIDSDLPGYVRAVVSRDVAGFDGRKILIPRGSRLIGQYKSGLAAGQSRAFVVWQRLIRPDGVSVQLGSPGTDTLGRAGLTGKVDSHFLKRFGSAMLLSVIDAGLGRLQNRGANVIVQSANDARSVASTALERDINIPPTVKVPQGTPIRIFIARDLDFSGFGSPPAP